MLDPGVLVYVQFVLCIIMAIYFWTIIRSQESHRIAAGRESRRELERLKEMRSIRLSEPLSERTRPSSLDQIVGQEDGIRALKAALCGPNPQHVIIYGPPGVGKTAAARLVLEEAKKSPCSPFRPDAKFIEVDATICRFDERGIADPLIGSVHDPIYQGAGQLGISGIPQPKPGAVTKAHGGILFLDEIGELHPTQLNKLLKVLEDRRVFLESAYYSKDDPNIPEYIHDVFQNGLPADFRLVGATTRQPEDVPPALRSRCLEIFFRSLSPSEIGLIAKRAAERAGVRMEDEAAEIVTQYAGNGREAVNMVEMAAGLATVEGRKTITADDIHWIVSQGRYSPRNAARLFHEPEVGVALALAVAGVGVAAVLDVEVQVIRRSRDGKGEVIITGAIDEEELGAKGRTVRRKSLIRSSVENVRTALSHACDESPYDYDLHVNFPGGVPVDGPSAGLAVAAAMYSAITGIRVRPLMACTGEISLRGEVRPVGGLEDKIRAASEVGLTTVVVPAGNQIPPSCRDKISVISVKNFTEALHILMAS